MITEINLGKLSQNQLSDLLSALAGALHTRQSFITLESGKMTQTGHCYYTVKYQGVRYIVSLTRRNQLLNVARKIEV